MATTTNYGWDTPDDTDLVKDGAAAIRTLGSSIDTTTKNLNPQTTTGALAYRSATANVNTALPVGSTGQVLTVAAGVPTWATPTTGDIEGVTAGTGISGGGTSGTVTITNSMATAIDAKGDLIAGTAADTFSRLAVGTNGQVLTAASGEATGLQWSTPATGTTFVGAAAYRDTSQTINQNTYTALTWPSEQYDTDGFHSTATNTSRFTIPSGKTGYYEVSCYVNMNSGVTEQIWLQLFLNGSKISTNGFFEGIFQQFPGTPNTDGIGGSTTYYLTAGDYVEVYMLQNNSPTATRTVESGRATITYLGA